MALILPDRVKVRSTTSGTGTFTLTTVMEGFRGFSAVGDGNETYYGIVDYSGHWEIGRGTWYSSSNTLSRDTVISSSNNNNKVNFPAGGKIVYSTFPSSLAQSIFSSTSTDSFSTISVAGQSDLNADSSTDTLTIVAGTGMTITTDSASDTITFNSAAATIPTDLENNGYNLSLLSDGNITYPGAITQSYTTDTVCNAGVDTVIYTSTGTLQHAIKLFVMAEGFTDGGGGSWDTQACDIIAVKGFNDNIIHVTAYGVTYTGSAAIATFDGQWNSMANRIEITCRPVSTTTGVDVKVHAIELESND